jgi:hypothetical protein
MANQYPPQQPQAAYASGSEAAQYHQALAAQAHYAAATAVTRVKVTDFDVPFGSLVVFLVKFAIAAIPAGLILSIIFGTVFGLLGGIFGAGLMRLF